MKFAVMILTASLLASCPSFLRAQQPTLMRSQAYMGLLQSDAVVAGKIDLDALSDSQIGRRLIERMDPPEGELPSAEGMVFSMNGNGEWVVLAATGNTPAIERLMNSNEDKFLGEVRKLYESYGNLDAFSSVLDDIKYSTLEYRGTPIVTLSKDQKRSQASLALIDQSILFVASSRLAVQQGIERVLDQSIPDPSGNLAEILANSETDHQCWIVCSIPPQGVPGGQAAQPQLGAMLMQLRLFVRDFSMTVDATDAIEYRMAANFANPQIAQSMHAMLMSGLNAQFNAQADAGVLGDPALLTRPDVRLDANGRLSVEVKLQEDQLMEIIDSQKPAGASVTNPFE